MVTLWHPRVPGVSIAVADTSDVAGWEAQGWGEKQATVPTSTAPHTATLLERVAAVEAAMRAGSTITTDSGTSPAAVKVSSPRPGVLRFG